MIVVHRLHVCWPIYDTPTYYGGVSKLFWQRFDVSGRGGGQARDVFRCAEQKKWRPDSHNLVYQYGYERGGGGGGGNNETSQ